MELNDRLTARLTASFGMRLKPADAERIQAHRKRVGVAAGAEVTPDVLVRLLFDDGVPCAWSYSEDEDFTYFDAYYVGSRGHVHGNP